MDKLEVQEYLTQGAVLAGQGRHDEALLYYNKAEKVAPMEIDVYLSKGIAYANLDRLEEAKVQFGKALRINRSSGLAYFHLGSIAILQGDVAQGFENYNKAIANGYDDAQVYYSIGLLHEENGEIDLAIRNYSKAISRDALRPDIRVRKARLLMEGRYYAEALQVLDETILTNPDVFEGYHMKFTLLLHLKQYEQAEELLDHAMELFPKDEGFVLDRVNLMLAKNKTEVAIELLNEVEKSENVDVKRRVCMERAQIYAAKEDIQSAITELNKARELSEKNQEFDMEAVFFLANAYLGAEEYEKTLECARLLIEKAEEGYYKQTAYYFEALSLKLLGRMEEALPLYQEAIRNYRGQSLVNPGNLDVYLMRVMCLRDIEEYEKALELIDYVISLEEEKAEPRMVRVTILEALGREEEAKEEAKQVNAILPEGLRKK